MSFDHYQQNHSESQQSGVPVSCGVRSLLQFAAADGADPEAVAVFPHAIVAEGVLRRRERVGRAGGCAQVRYPVPAAEGRALDFWHDNVCVSTFSCGSDRK